jgi:glycosyltransferase involved in cell wall biosynthesis
MDDAGTAVIADAQKRRADICVLGLRGFPNVLGGVETHCEQILSRVSRQSPYRFVVLARRGYVHHSRHINSRLEVRPIGAVRNKYLEALPNALLGALHAWVAVRPRILHIHAIGPALVAPLAKALGMKVVVTHHGRDYMRAKWNWLARAALRLGEAAAIKFADRVIVVSPSLAADLKRAFPKRADRICYIPNGAAPPAEPTADTTILQNLSVAPGQYVLAVGRLVPEKRFQDLIAAHRQCGTAMKLVIAGAADHRDTFARELTASGDDQIIFAGMQGKAPLNVLYRNASLFVLPSSHEGLPVAALEAVAAGTPVLLSDIAANLDVGPPRENYFPMGDIETLATALQGEHARFRTDAAEVMAAFDWDRVAAQTLGVYYDVLNIADAPALTAVATAPRRRRESVSVKP